MKDISELPANEVDLIVFGGAIKHAPSTLETALIEKKVKSAIIFSSGGKEIEGGEKINAQIRGILERAGNPACLGENCFGNFVSDPSFNTTFAVGSRTTPILPGGSVSFIGQSGGNLVELWEYLFRSNIPLSKIATLGNATGVRSGELMRYMALTQPPHPAGKPAPILWYLEGETDPRLIDNLSKVTATNPVLVLRGGSTPEGGKRAASHTGKIVTSNAETQMALQQGGAIQVNSLEHAMKTIDILNNSPVPPNSNLAVFSFSGGRSVLTTDQAVTVGLKIAKLSPETQAKLRRLLPSFATIQESATIDTTAQIHVNTVRKLMRILHDAPEVGGIAAVFLDHPNSLTTDPKRWQLDRLSTNKPIYIHMAGQGDDAIKAASILREKLKPKGFIVSQAPEDPRNWLEAFSTAMRVWEQQRRASVR